MKRLSLCLIICLFSASLLAQQADTLKRRPQRIPRRLHAPIQKIDTVSSVGVIPPQQSTEPLPAQPVPPQQSGTFSPAPESPKAQLEQTIQKLDTLSQTGEIAYPKTNTVAGKPLILPPGAKDTVNLSFRDTDIRDIFRALAVQHNLNIVVDNSISKRATISLSRVQVYDAMKFICEQNSIRLELEGGIFRVLPLLPPRKVELLAKVPWVYYENNLLSVKLKNDDLEATVLEIQKKSGKNILILGGTTGSLSGTLNDIDFDIGFTQLLNNNGFAVQKKSGIYVVSRLDYFVGQQQGTQGQKGGAYWISVKDSLVTIDVSNAQLDRVLTDIVRQLNTDVVFYNEVKGTVTARATNVLLDKALDMILRNTTFGYRESEGIYYIGEKTNKALMATKLFKLKYLRSDKILDNFPQSISSQATIKVMKEHNGIVVIGPNDVIAQAAEYLSQIDKPIAQVLIEAIVVDYNRSKGLELGVSAGYLGTKDSTASFSRTDALIPGIDMMFSGNQLSDALQAAGAVNIGRLPSNFFLKLKALEQKGLANIKSRPLLATLNGSPATLSIGTTFYFKLTTTTPFAQYNSQPYLSQSEQFTTVDADTKLEITPFVGADGQITVELKPDFKTPVGQPSGGIPPTINRRAMSSTLVIKEGETIVLGGLIQETESETRTQVPLLGSIPILGYLFSSTTRDTNKSELIIYITPHISYGEAFQNVSLPMQE
jgi:type IV pilus assembly protein PilQ